MSRCALSCQFHVALKLSSLISGKENEYLFEVLLIE